MNSNRLLVIDDDEDVCEVFAEIGESLGYLTYCTSDPVEFQARTADWRPSVIITDLQMPRMDGLTLLRFLAGTKTPASIIVISGLGQKVLQLSSMIARERGLQIAGTVSKPFDLLTVIEVLNRLKAPGSFGAGEIHGAIAAGQMQIFLQPKCRLESGAVIGAEALARWVHPSQGVIPPAQFIPLTDQPDLAWPFLECILQQAVAQVADWAACGIDIDVAANMSVRNVEMLDLPDRLENICASKGVSPEKVTLELVESGSLEPSADALDVLTRLRVKGFRLSIDDLGTGFSSLSRLRQLPFSEIKVDHSFTSKIMSDEESAVIVRAIVGMAADLGMVCVAEGIEDSTTARRLMAWGYRFGQGYYFGKAMPVADFNAWMRRGYARGLTDSALDIDNTLHPAKALR